MEFSDNKAAAAVCIHWVAASGVYKTTFAVPCSHP
jgi:hypothetical protein